MDDPLWRWVNQDVILDTATPICTIAATGMPARKYTWPRPIAKVTINRRTVVVMRSAIISVSRLAYVVVD